MGKVGINVYFMQDDYNGTSSLQQQTSLRDPIYHDAKATGTHVKMKPFLFTDLVFRIHVFASFLACIRYINIYPPKKSQQ